MSNFNSIKNKISSLLQKYDDLFYSESIFGLRKKYPRYVALYTPVLECPDFAIVGNNPSWFIGKKPENNADQEKENYRTDSLKGVHDINSYTHYPEPRYHRELRSFFKKYIEKADTKYHSYEVDQFINKNVMGWNSQFIQTGSEGFGELKQYCKQNEDFLNLFTKANEIAMEITTLVKPKIIIHFGVPSAYAAGEYKDAKKNSPLALYRVTKIEELEKKIKKTDSGYRVVFHHPSQGYSKKDRDLDIDVLIALIKK